MKLQLTEVEMQKLTKIGPVWRIPDTVLLQLLLKANSLGFEGTRVTGVSITRAGNDTVYQLVEKEEIPFAR